MWRSATLASSTCSTAERWSPSIWWPPNGDSYPRLRRDRHKVYAFLPQTHRAAVYAGLTRARETGRTLALMRFVVVRQASAARPLAESRADPVAQGGMED
jgi:hypothetical protein